jgi:hypothetical protein
LAQANALGVTDGEEMLVAPATGLSASAGAHGAPSPKHARATSRERAPVDASGGSAPGGAVSASAAAAAASALGLVGCDLLPAASCRWSQLLRPRTAWHLQVVLALPERPG